MEKKSARDISALVDGECSSEEQERLLDRLCENESLSEEWGKLHHLKSLLKNEHYQIRYDNSLVTRVLSEIEQLTPDEGAGEITEIKSSQHIGGRTRFGFQWRPVWLGGALATAAVGVALFGVFTTIFDYAAPPEDPPLLVALEASLAADSAIPADKNLTNPELDRLNNALQNHYRFSSSGVFNNVSHLVRYVSYNP